MTGKRFHGITSLILVLLACGLGLVAILLRSWVWGLIYLGVMAGAPIVVVRTYCAKCACKEHCAHVWPGKIARSFAKDPSPYTTVQILGVVVALAALLGLPQFWLWQRATLLVPFWVFTGIALTQIRLAICPACNNTFCPLRVKSRISP
jgi:hypothetical protein